MACPRRTQTSSWLSVALDATPAVNSTLAVHGWCSAAGAGAVVLPYINLAASSVALALGGGLGDGPRVEFILTAPNGNLTADALLLNGVPLGVDSSGKLAVQPIPGKAVAGGAAIVLPEQSFGFLVFPGAGAVACN